MKYIVVKGSQSAHCCFAYTVVDTGKPVMIGDEHYANHYEIVCETFDESSANLICNALNAAQQGVRQTCPNCCGEKYVESLDGTRFNCEVCDGIGTIR